MDRAREPREGIFECLDYALCRRGVQITRFFLTSCELKRV
jgi:hypothetical protein